MAVSASSVIEMRTTGGANNSGGFVTGASGVDYSQQDAAQYALTGCTTAGASATFANANAAADMVGNFARVVSGTNFTAGWYQIISVNVGTDVTCDRNVASGIGSNGVINIGGAISTFQDAFLETLEPGNIVHVKVGTYTLAENIAVAKDGTAASPITIRGYNTTRNDSPTGTNRPLITGGAFGFTLDNAWKVENIRGTSSGSNGLRADDNAVFQNVKWVSSDTNAVGFALNGGGLIGAPTLFINCEAETSASGPSAVRISGTGVIVDGCKFKSATMGILTTTAGTMLQIAYSIVSGGGGVNLASTGSFKSKNCTYYGAETPAGTGITVFGAGVAILFSNNIVYGWTTGISQATANQTTNYYDYNDFFNNTTDRTNVTAGAGDIALDPQFTDAANGDFSIGTNLKATGFPGVFPGALTTGYIDIGAVQRQESSSGGGSTGNMSIYHGSLTIN